MKSIRDLNLHKVTGPNGEQVYPENSFKENSDGTVEWIVSGHWISPLRDYDRPEDFGGTFSGPDAAKIASEIGGTCDPLTEDQVKSIVCSEISDVSKEWCGSRRRIHAADYTLEELEEELTSYYNMIQQERDAEKQAAHDKMVAANKRKDDRNYFDKAFTKMENAFTSL